MRRRLLPVLLLLATASACVRNPVTGKQQLSLVSEKQEIQLGQQAKQEVDQSIGVVQNPELQKYVSDLGMRMAKHSERPNLPWSFQVIDDASVNAFALPGGPIFVTRGLLTYMNDEAELAIVVGHEIGHVTAKHSVNMISKQQLAQVGLGVGTILLPENLRGLGQLAGAGASLMFLKFGRDAERQSDQLGFRYALRENYDVREMKSVFTTLNQAGGGEGRLPEWLSTHPNPENRITAADRMIKEAHITDFSKLQVRRDEYLARVNGLVFGENPRNGFFKGNAFLHPDLKFQLTFPSGWKAQNQPASVAGISPRQDAIIELAPAGTMSPEAAAQKFFSTPGVRRGDVQAGNLNSLPTVAGYFAADTEQGTLAGIVAFISYQGKTYQLIGYTPAQLLSTYDATLRGAISSFGPLTDPAALNVQPAKIEVFRVPNEMTLSQAYSQFPSTVPLKTFSVINGFAPEARIPAGTRLKRVVGGTPVETTNQPSR